MKTKNISVVVGIALLSCYVSAASAAENLQGRNWASSCVTCHGGHGSGGMPALAGREKSTIVTAMQEFRDGKRTATVMHQIAKGYSDAQVEQIATYFSQQKP